MKKTVLIVIRVVCIVGFLVCVGVLGWYWHSDRSDRAVAEALAAAHDAASAEAMEQVRAVAADNADTIGWLRIDGTNINNVVMFAPDTPGKYLHMDFYGKWSYRGTLYVAENCDVRTADNILIYGHHMKDGSMFGSLISYKDAAFRAAHPIVQFDTLYASHSYEVVAAIETEIPAEGSDAFRYYDCIGTDPEQFAQYCTFIEQNRMTPASRSSPATGCSRCPPVPTTRRTAVFWSWRGRSTEEHTKTPPSGRMAGFLTWKLSSGQPSPARTER